MVAAGGRLRAGSSARYRPDNDRRDRERGREGRREGESESRRARAREASPHLDYELGPRRGLHSRHEEVSRLEVTVNHRHGMQVGHSLTNALAAAPAVARV